MNAFFAHRSTRTARWPGMLLAASLLGLALAGIPAQASADIAPPDYPPGANLAPGSEVTQVQMVAETVTLAVQRQTTGSAPGQVITTADFLMRNLGAETERLEVRFPLTFLYGMSNGWGEYPEIRDPRVRINGGSVATRRVNSSALHNSNENDTVPWAAFDVSFPPGEDVQIQVMYTGDGIGEYPYVGFRYILETGAGWKGPIGSADLIVHYPYEVSPHNVLLSGTTGFSETSPNATLSGQEIRWHYADLEPTWEDNLSVSLVMPAAWEKVLRERDNVTKNPRDGEAWGRLGKVYKEISRLRRGLREDAAGLALYALAVEAYEQATTLKPNDALWHYGFAELLWDYYYWNVFVPLVPDHSQLVRAVQHLKACLDIDPRNQQALDLLASINAYVPGALQEQAGGSYEYLVLTATPTYAPTRTPWPTDTPLIEPTPTQITTETPTPTARPTATQTPPPTTAGAPTQAEIAAEEAPAAAENKSGLPICGGALLPAALLGVVVVVRKK